MQDRLVAEPTRLNYRDFCALPEDGKRYEILDGDLYMSPAPQPLHQRVVRNLACVLIRHVNEHHLGEVLFAPCDVVLGDHDIVEPDLIFVSRARESIVRRENIRGVPDLLVEILSPTRPDLDTRDKRNVYERCGVPFYWILDPQEQRITELQLVDRAYAVVAQVGGNALFMPCLFPGLVIDLGTIWD